MQRFVNLFTSSDKTHFDSSYCITAIFLSGLGGNTQTNASCSHLNVKNPQELISVYEQAIETHRFQVNQRPYATFEVSIVIKGLLSGKKIDKRFNSLDGFRKFLEEKSLLSKYQSQQLK